jgi:hypothetical protein
VTGPAPPQNGSTLRTLIGVVCLASSLVIIAASFVLMVRALEVSGYGSPGVTRALLWMAGGGAALGAGMALLIWEFSVRYGIRH